ncbi:MAG: LysR family transcriptional regulator [Saprospiraceae bacterium]
MNSNKLIISGRVWINSSNQASLGKGKIKILEGIIKFGSLRQAALDMKMSYQQAWKIVNELNSDFENEVVILQRGGKDGGKAIVTDFGLQMLAFYNSLQKDFEKFLAKQSEKINKNFN